MSSVDIYLVKGKRKRHLAHHDNVDVDPGDNEGLRGLAKRLAKENKIAPEDAELVVQQGRKKVPFRL